MLAWGLLRLHASHAIDARVLVASRPRKLSLNAGGSLARLRRGSVSGHLPLGKVAAQCCCAVVATALGACKGALGGSCAMLLQLLRICLGRGRGLRPLTSLEVAKVARNATSCRPLGGCGGCSGRRGSWSIVPWCSGCCFVVAASLFSSLALLGWSSCLLLWSLGTSGCSLRCRSATDRKLGSGLD